MPHRRLFLHSAVFALIGLVSGTPARAQDSPSRSVAWSYEMTVDATHDLEFAEGMKGWMQRAGEDGETWTWNVFQAVTGPPRYVVMTPGHAFADFDRQPVADEARQKENQEWFQEQLAPYFRDPVSVIMAGRDELSVPIPEGDQPPRFWNVIEWELTDNSTEAYLALTNAFGKIREAFVAMNEQAVANGAEPGGYTVFDVAFTEGPPRMMIALPFNAFGGLDGQDPIGFFNALAATHGHEDAILIEAVLGRYLRQLRAHAWAYRPDLSYTPDSGM